MKRLALCFLGSLLALAPVLVYAHGNSYLEFNPDKTNSLKISGAATPSQVFFAQSDFLSGFDVWLSNPGSSGTATFSLLNEQGDSLTSKTVSISNIAQTDTGTKFHVDFNSQLTVLADQKYSIKIVSSMPELRIYYSDRVKLISHDAPFVSPYITGVALLGSEEQPFSFKYALYETTETSAPIISNVAWSVVSEAQMKMEFNTNEAVDYKIEYGPSSYILDTNFLGAYQFCTEGILNCSITISVSPNTSYQYRLTVKDAWGNQTQQTGTFQSGESQAPTSTPTSSPTPSVSGSPTSTPTPSATPDTEDPVITNLRTVDLDNNSVGIAWTTGEPASSFLQIVREVDFDLIVTSFFDPTIELEHYIETDAVLSPNTSYVARVRSSDQSGNEVEQNLEFTTLSSTPTPTPMGSQEPTPSVSASPTPTVTSSSEDGSSVQWNSPASGEPSDGYRIDVFDKEGNFVKTVYAPSGSSSVEIPGLEEGDYTVIVYENDEGVFKKVDKPVELKVKKFEDEPLLKRLAKLWYLLVPVFIMIGYLIWNHLKKPSQTLQNPVS
jgi:hypothetical protein